MAAVEAVVGPEKAADLIRIANDEMADLVQRHPDSFVTAIGILPMNNIGDNARRLMRLPI